VRALRLLGEILGLMVVNLSILAWVWALHLMVNS